MIATESAPAPEEISVLREHEVHHPLRRYAWGIACAAVLLVAVVLRFYKLELKPLHNDESVNAFFFLRLFRENFYQYDPVNYHGPTLYYFALIASSVSTLFFKDRGLSIFVLRSVPALFGVATIFLILQLRKYLGTMATLASAALLAVSPGAVYFSRDFIHETILVFFTLAVVVGALHLYDSASAKSALMLSIVTALLFATKETAAISIGVLLVALGGTLFWRSRRLSEVKTLVPKLIGYFFGRFGGAARATRLSLASMAIFVLLWIIFYSSFFGNFRTLHDALTSLKVWANTGTTAHRHPITTYFVWLEKEEWPLLVLGTAGTVIAASRRKYFPLFVGLWAFGLFIAYSLIPYKTPWLTLNFIIPLALAAGYAASEIYSSLRARSRRGSHAWVVVLTAMIATSFFSTWQLNFYRYDDDRNPYVYAQTRREVLGLIEKVNAIAKMNGAGSQTSIAVMSPDYWPLPWYLREYPNTGYFGGVVAIRTDIVIASTSQAVRLEPLLGADYKRLGEYPLRPGVNLVAFARSY